MEAMDFLDLINKHLLILIPALYILGRILKGTKRINSKYIPLILLPVGIILALFMSGFDVESVVQGILVTGAAVYADQLVKIAVNSKSSSNDTLNNNNSNNNSNNNNNNNNNNEDKNGQNNKIS